MNSEIDFDYASKRWRENKKYQGKGVFVYICNYIHSNNKRCRRTVYSCLPANPYKSQFNNVEFKNLYYKPNKDIFCKKHLNRKRPDGL